MARSLAELTELTVKISSHLKSWNIEARTLDLMEEVGELSNAILVAEGYKNRKREKAEIEDSLADILFNLLLISKYYKVDFEKEYTEMLERLEVRIRQKEFED